MVLASCSKMGQVHYCLSKLRYGYPVKHPLSEQFGMTLLQPLRLLREIRMFSLFWWPGKAVESYDSLRIYWARRQQISSLFFKTTCCLMLVQNHSELLCNGSLLFFTPSNNASCLHVWYDFEGIGCPVVMKSASWSTLHRQNKKYLWVVHWWCKDCLWYLQHLSVAQSWKADADGSHLSKLADETMSSSWGVGAFWCILLHLEAFASNTGRKHAWMWLYILDI